MTKTAILTKKLARKLKSFDRAAKAVKKILSKKGIKHVNLEEMK